MSQEGQEVLARLAAVIGEIEVRRDCEIFLNKRTTSGVLPAKRSAFKPRDVEKRFVRQGGRCNLCKAPTPLDEMKRDHIVPVIKGGETVLSNLELLCKPCHDKKGTEHPLDTAVREGTTLTKIYEGDHE